MLIWILMAIGVVVIASVLFGRRRYTRVRGGAHDNPSSHNRGHAKDHHQHPRRGRGRKH
jgi:hypothetical protein